MPVKPVQEAGGSCSQHEMAMAVFTVKLTPFSFLLLYSIVTQSV